MSFHYIDKNEGINCKYTYNKLSLFRMKLGASTILHGFLNQNNVQIWVGRLLSGLSRFLQDFKIHTPLKIMIFQRVYRVIVFEIFGFSGKHEQNSDW